jgi:hypothetical protein
LGGGGVENAVADEALVDMKGDDLAKNQIIVERRALPISQRDDLAHLAFHGGVAFGDAGRADQPARRHRQAGMGKFALAARQGRRSLAHRMQQIQRRQIDHEFAAVARESRRILGPFAGKADNRRRG